MQKILRCRKQLAVFLLFSFVFGTFFPQSVATAQALFTRPGAGVSRLPLNVFAFDAPEFGTVVDAINLANGNVFLSMNDLSRNNVVTTGQDETTNSIGNSLWQLSSRLRLEGFRRDLTTSTVPATFFLGNGDGSGDYFKRVEKNTLTFSELPTWIARYETVANAYLYRLQPQKVLQYTQEWIVLLPGASQAANNAVAHYYGADGTRNTFYSDGEYLDYSQDIYQKYRSASSFDPEGISSSVKTQINYTATGSGRISSVQDEYGRVTNYVWNLSSPGGDGDPTTLDRINYLVVNSNAARFVTFVYETTTIGTTPIQRIKTVKFSGKDGFSNTNLVREYEVVYNANNFIASITRKSNDTNTIPNLVTSYFYDTTYPNRVSSVTRNDGTPETFYTYAETRNTTTNALESFTVTVSQDSDTTTSAKDKETIYEYNADGYLTSKKVWDSQLDGTGGYLLWTYGYYPTGSTRFVKEPSSMTTVYAYDEKGNLTEVRTFKFQFLLGKLKTSFRRCF